MRKNQRRISSSSAGAKVQVEYTRTPPGLSIFSASASIDFCLSAHKVTFSGVHSFIAVSSFLNIPSPEHGASTTILSKKHGKNFAMFSGVSLHTTAFGTPSLSIFCERILARCGKISFETRNPLLPSIPAICVDLPPGAAQRSQTFGGVPSVKIVALSSGVFLLSLLRNVCLTLSALGSARSAATAIALGSCI